MRKLVYIIFPLLITTLVVMSCGKKPWEHYVAPEFIPLPPEPPREKEPARNETFRVKVMSIGVFRNNSKLYDNADTIQKYDPDVVFVREIDRSYTGSGRGGAGVYQDDDLVAYLGSFDKSYYHYFLPAVDQTGGGQFGCVILSKQPLENTIYDRTIGANRVLGRATTMVNGFPITFAGAQVHDVTRAGNATDIPDRTAQLTNINAALKPIDGPMILALGLHAFNTDTEPGLIVLREQFTSGCSPCAFNIPAGTPNNTGDHIMFKPMNTEIGDVNVIEYKVLQNGAVDRRAVYAELEFKQ